MQNHKPPMPSSAYYNNEIWNGGKTEKYKDYKKIRNKIWSNHVSWTLYYEASWQIVFHCVRQINDLNFLYASIYIIIWVEFESYCFTRRLESNYRGICTIYSQQIQTHFRDHPGSEALCINVQLCRGLPRVCKIN